MLLNRAHALQRQAEKARKKGHWAESIACHKEAATLLHSLLETVVNRKIWDSVQLQAQFHEREQQQLREFQRRSDHIARQIERLKIRMDGGEEAGFGPQHGQRAAYGFERPPNLAGGGGPGSQQQLQQHIYRTFAATETLLDRLREREAAEAAAATAAAPAVPPRPPIKGTKKPKDDKVTIEELEVANSHLRRMVDSLFVELDHCQRENGDLRERVCDLEERLRLTQLEQQERDVRRQRERQQQQQQQQQQQERLPTLPPLEMPTFNFDT